MDMKHNITMNDIKNLLDEDCYYGLRAEDFEYQIGDSCHKSHQLYQDAMYADDEAYMNNEPLYPYCEEGIYEGYYDAGELDGTCAIKIEFDDDESINSALDKVNCYFGDYIYLIKGYSEEIGNDIDEVIIHDATVVGKFKRS